MSSKELENGGIQRGLSYPERSICLETTYPLLQTLTCTYLLLLQVLQSTWYHYADATSIHGLNYASDVGMFTPVRVAWRVVLFGLTLLAYILVAKAYKEWQDNPVVTYVNSTGKRSRHL